MKISYGERAAYVFVFGRSVKCVTGSAALPGHRLVLRVDYRNIYPILSDM